MLRFLLLAAAASAIKRDAKRPLKALRARVAGGESVASALSRADKLNVAASFVGGGLALYEMREELLELGHHHGLLMVALSRLARTFADLEELALQARKGLRARAGLLKRLVLNHRTLRLLCVFALVASGYEVFQDLKPGGHHGMLLLSLHELHDVGEEVVGEGESPLARILGNPFLKLALAAGALGFAAVELAEDLTPGAHHGVAAIALGHVVKGVATVRAELKEATHAD